MADPSLRLDPTNVSVQPGGQAQVAVTVTSGSDIVEGYRLTVLGAQPTQWAEVVPPVVNVYPGEEASAVVVFTPPTGTKAESGRFAFGVKATSTESADASSVAEGTVELGQVSGLQAKIVPVTSSARWRGRHVVRLDNWGNAPARLRLVATDPDAVLGFYVKPDVVELPIGASTTVRITARARRPFLRGATVRHPFQVVGEPLETRSGPAPATPYGDPGRPVVDAALAQQPILTRTVVTLVGLVLVAAIAGGAYAWTRPQGAPGSIAKLGTPPTPQDLAVVGSDASSVRLRWKPVDQIESYTLQHVDPSDGQTITGVDTVNGSQNATVVKDLAPATKACFRLLANRPGLPGPATPVVCGQTAAAPVSPSPSPSTSSASSASSGSSPGQDASGQSASGPAPPPPPGSPATGPSPSQSTPPPVGGPLSGQWVLVADFAAQTTPGGREAVDQTTKKLQANGVATAQTVGTQQYPGLKLGGTPNELWLSVVGPYPAPEQATADCPKVKALKGTQCISAKP